MTFVHSKKVVYITGLIYIDYHYTRLPLEHYFYDTLCILETLRYQTQASPSLTVFVVDVVLRESVLQVVSFLDDLSHVPRAVNTADVVVG